LKTKQSEVHVFIIWSKGLSEIDFILKDLESNFEIIKKTKVTWSPLKFSENLSRFYGENLPKNSSKEKHCGKDTFLCVVVKDNNVVYDLRPTSKGLKAVNINMFDAKQRYREMTGGGHKIHATDNITESRHNLFLLYGFSYDNVFTDGKNILPDVYKNDLIGAYGWKSLDEVFEAFNELTNYVVLRNFENLDEELNSLHPDIDLLTDNRALLVDILNGKNTFKDNRRVQYLVQIDGKDVNFDFRYIGDNYYSYRWEQDILRSRIKYKEFYIPEAKDHFYSLMYHAFIHKEKLVEDYVSRLIELSKDVGLDYNIVDFVDFKVLDDLNDYMTTNNYDFTEPIDLSVYYSINVINKYVRCETSIERGASEKKRKIKIKIKNAIRKKFGKYLGKYNK